MRDTLKFRMIVIAICVHLSIWFVAVAFSSWTAINVIFDSLDQELETQVKYVEFSSRVFVDFLTVLNIPVNEEMGQRSISVSDALGWTGNPMVFWNAEKLEIYRTPNAPRFAVPAAAGFYDVDIMQEAQSVRWRVYYHKLNDVFWIAVGADTREVRQAAIEVGVKALYPMILIIPLSILGIYWGSSRGLRPMAKLAEEVKRRSPTSLEPVDTTGIHGELRPLLEALNSLMHQLSGALENEHRFTANAAHELQTPLTAIKAEVQMHQRSAGDPAVAAMLEGIESRVDRAVHTVKQLLTLARLESEDVSLNRARLNLHEVVQDVLADHAHTALERGLSIDFPEDQSWWLMGQRDALEIMVGNVLRNAIRYTPRGGQVRIACDPGNTLSGDGLAFSISNECDSMNDAERERLVDRFYRRPGTDSPGAGLGLSIVQHIAAVHGAKLAVCDWQDGRGLSVSIVFPNSS